MEVEQPFLGDLLTMVINHLQVLWWSSKQCFWNTMVVDWSFWINKSTDSQHYWNNHQAKPVLLLMAEILHHPIIYMVLYIPGGDRRISEPSTVWSESPKT